MIKKVFHIVCMTAGITCVIPAVSQYRQDYNWVTGSYHLEEYKKPIIQFGEDTVRIKEKYLPFAFSAMNSCISDENGNLLLYFNGCNIANGNHEILENGSGFNEGITGNWECPKNHGYPGPYQSALILPKPGSPLFHYVFYTRYDDLPTTIESSLLYAETDLASAKGKVLYKDKHALTDSVVTLSGITAVKHINNEDWWLILARRYTSRYARLLITADGPVEYPDISIGEDSIKSGGQASFSPDGTKYMRYTHKGLMVMDFDRSTGLLSDYRLLSFVPEGVFFGGTFSPNGRFIYLSSRDKIYQVDTWEEELALELVAEWDGYTFEGWKVLFGMMQTGPDCRIYISSLNELPHVHIIMYPDKKGTACNVVQRALTLPWSCAGFPHFPNFRLGTPYPYCDPDKVVITGTNVPAVAETKLDIFPNPSSGDFTIQSDGIIESIHVFDINGTCVHSVHAHHHEVSISTYEWKSGMYFVHINQKNMPGHPTIRKLVVLP